MLVRCLLCLVRSCGSYFPFEDVLTDVVAAFSRDGWVAANSVIPPHSPIMGVAGDGSPLTAIPPSGVTPFNGFAM